MAMMNVEIRCLLTQTCSSTRLAWSKGRWPPGTILHSSNYRNDSAMV